MLCRVFLIILRQARPNFILPIRPISSVEENTKNLNRRHNSWGVGSTCGLLSLRVLALGITIGTTKQTSYHKHTHPPEKDTYHISQRRSGETVPKMKKYTKAN